MSGVMFFTAHVDVTTLEQNIHAQGRKYNKSNNNFPHGQYSELWVKKNALVLWSNKGAGSQGVGTRGAQHLN